MLFLFHQGKNAAEATRIICLTYSNVLNVNKCQYWFRRFILGDFNISDLYRSGRPSKFDNDALRLLVESDPRKTIQELSIDLGSSWSTVQRHLNSIGKVNRCGVWIPHKLSESNKAQRKMICSDLLARQEREPFLHRIVGMRPKRRAAKTACGQNSEFSKSRATKTSN